MAENKGGRPVGSTTTVKKDRSRPRLSEELAEVIRLAREEARTMALHGDPTAGLIRLRAIANETIRHAVDEGLQREVSALFHAAVEAFERRWEGELEKQIIP